MANAATRRALLTGKAFHNDGPDDAAADGYAHISSAVVSVLPARRDAVAERLRALPGVEIHQSNAHKIVVVLEGANSGQLGGLLAEISSWPGVLSANMVFEQSVERESLNDPVTP